MRYTNITLLHYITYGTGSVKMWKTRRKIPADIRIFFTVRLSLTPSNGEGRQGRDCKLARHVDCTAWSGGNLRTQSID